MIIGKEAVYPVLLNGAVCKALIDTGSQVSIISEAAYKKYFNYVPIKDVNEFVSIKTVTGGDVGYLGTVELCLHLGKNLSGSNDSVHVLFLVTSNDTPITPTDGDLAFIVGMNALEVIWNQNDSTKSDCVLNRLFSSLDKIRLCELENSGFLGAVKSTSNDVIPPKSSKRLRCCFRSHVPICKSLVVIEGKGNGSGISPSLFECDLTPFTRVSVLVENSSDQVLEISKGSIIGGAWLSSFPTQQDQIQECNISSIHIDPENFPEVDEYFNQENHPGFLDEDEDDVPIPDFDALIDVIDQDKSLTEDSKIDLKNVIMINEKAFSKSEYDIGCVKDVKHSYVLIDDRPFKLAHRNLPPKMYEAARDHINQLLEKGIIRPSISPYSSAPLFIRKSDGRVRMVSDMRILNEKVVRDNYALPRFDDILPFLAGAKIFSKMDLRSGYYNIEVEECDKPKTAFSTVFGLYEYNRMAQGAKTSSATFQRCMENIL